MLKHRRDLRQFRFCKRWTVLIIVLVLFPILGWERDHTRIRARELGVPFEGRPGKFNAITDVSGVLVGHTTLISGEGKLVVGNGPVRTGVTAILPRGKKFDPVFAGWSALNAVGEMTGTKMVDEAGLLEGPILITNSSSVGVVRDSIIDWQKENQFYKPFFADYWGSLPVVAETYDGILNDIHGFHVNKEHVFSALDGASSGPVDEGNVGGGTGIICHGFKGGIGTSSRIAPEEMGGFTVGALVQANHGDRPSLTIAGVPVGREISDLEPVINVDGGSQRGGSSIIVVIATDAPLLPHQLKRLAHRAALGIAKVGGIGHHFSGDIFIAFSTANPGTSQRIGIVDLKMLQNETITGLFRMTVQATEEAIVNALVAAKTMTGINGNMVYALPHNRLRDVLKKYNRLREK